MGVPLWKSKTGVKNPGADWFGWMSAEWLAKAAAATGANEMLGFHFEYRGAPDVVRVAADRDEIMRFEHEYSHAYTCLTTPDEKFLYWNEQGNDYYLLCGSAAFLAVAHPISRDTAARMYFEAIAPVTRERTPGFERMLALWRRYAPDQDIDALDGQDE